MNMKNFKISPAQQLIGKAILSAAGGAATTGITAATQYYTSNGFNVPALINVFVVASFVLFGKTLYDFVPGHIQTIIQAYQDSIGDLRNAQAANVASIQQTPVATPVSPVVIHISGNGTVSSVIPDHTVNTYTPAVSQDAQSVSLTTAQVQQIPFPALPQPIQSSDILGNIPNPSTAQGLPINNVTGQYAIYGAPAQQ